MTQAKKKPAKAPTKKPAKTPDAPKKRVTAASVRRSRTSIAKGTAAPLTEEEEAVWMREALKELSPREERFVAEFLKELNQTEAYMRAYNVSNRATARTQAAQVMSRPNVQLAIQQARRRDMEIAGLDRVRILRELVRVALVDIRQAFNDDGTLKSPKDWPDDLAAAVAGLEVAEIRDVDGTAIGNLKKFKLLNKMEAIDKAMRHLGLFELDNKQVNEASQVSREDLDAIYANGAARMLELAAKVQGRSARLDAKAKTKA